MIYKPKSIELFFRMNFSNVFYPYGARIIRMRGISGIKFDVTHSSYN
jgi:hypothetical protein